MISLFHSLSAEKKHLVLLIIIYIGFVSLGLPDTILGVAWDPMHQEFDNPIYYAGLISTLLTICSAISAFFSGAILRRIVDDLRLCHRLFPAWLCLFALFRRADSLCDPSRIRTRRSGYGNEFLCSQTLYQP